MWQKNIWMMYAIGKAKREKAIKANRNKGAEPEEIIIPGIND